MSRLLNTSTPTIAFNAARRIISIRPCVEVAGVYPSSPYLHKHHSTGTNYAANRKTSHTRTSTEIRQHSTTSSDNTNNSSEYESPFQDFFDMIDSGTTSMGTTDSDMSAILGPVECLDCGIPKGVLKVETTSFGRYMLPPYVTPGEHKITVKLDVKHIPFQTEREREVFHQIVGKRYNAEKNELKLTSNQFASRIENYRHITSMLDRIVESSKRLAREAAEEERNGVSIE